MKYTVVEIETTKDGIKGKTLVLRRIPPICKECNKNDRANGSSRCENCSEKHKQINNLRRHANT